MEELLINRIRTAISLGMTQAEICMHFINTDMGESAELVYLAYHAAEILVADNNEPTKCPSGF
jgi:hypothetical protein